MKRLSLALPFAGEEPIERLSQALLAHPLVNRVLWLSQIEVISPPFGIEPIKVDSFFAGETIQRLCETCADDYLLLFFPGSLVEFGERALERMATAHLRRINAHLEPHFAEVPDAHEPFPVKASIIIPVRNREKTISDAVQSALSQATDFAFNVIVVDNHSTDQTTALLAQLA